MRRNVRAVPAFLIGDDMVVGLDRAKILGLVDHRLIDCANCGAKLRVPRDKQKLAVTCPRCKHQFTT